MLFVNIIWLCAYNKKKCIKDITSIKSFSNLININLKINFVILDRRKKGIVENANIRNINQEYFLVYSSKNRSHQADYYFVINNIKSDFILTLSDDDKIIYKSLILYLNNLFKYKKEKIILAVPRRKDNNKNIYNNLELYKNYDFWGYQLNRGPNLAHYSAISTKSLRKCCAKFIYYSPKIWRHPMYDQAFIWSVLNRGKDKIKTVNFNFLIYDNLNWSNRENVLNSINKFNLKKETEELLVFKEIFSIYSDNKFDFQVLLWFIYLLYRNLRYYRSLSRSLNCLKNLCKVLLNKFN